MKPPWARAPKIDHFWHHRDYTMWRVSRDLSVRGVTHFASRSDAIFCFKIFCFIWLWFVTIFFFPRRELFWNIYDGNEQLAHDFTTSHKLFISLNYRSHWNSEYHWLLVNFGCPCSWGFHQETAFSRLSSTHPVLLTWWCPKWSILGARVHGGFIKKQLLAGSEAPFVIRCIHINYSPPCFPTNKKQGGE